MPLGSQLNSFESGYLRPKARSFTDRPGVLDMKRDKWDFTIAPSPHRTFVLPCSPGSFWSPEHGYQPIAKCGSSSCIDCGLQKKKAFMAMMQEARDFHGGSFYFTTVTFRHHDGDTGLDPKTMNKYAQRLSIYVAKLLPSDDRSLKNEGRPYMKVIEFTKAGVPHYHIVHFGVDPHVTKTQIEVWRKMIEDEWRRITGRRSWQTNFQKGYGLIGPYLAKYLTKTEDMPKKLMSRVNKHGFVSFYEKSMYRLTAPSRNLWRRPVVKKISQLLYKFGQHHDQTPREWAFGYRPGLDPAGFTRESLHVGSAGYEKYVPGCDHKECERVFDLTPRRYWNVPKDTLLKYILIAYDDTPQVRHAFERSYKLMLDYRYVVEHRELDNPRRLESSHSRSSLVASPV